MMLALTDTVMFVLDALTTTGAQRDLRELEAKLTTRYLISESVKDEYRTTKS
jgi:hypothetical protein